MGREISLFANYHQNENVTTNYCGLVMKLLYEESPKRFEELLATLVKTDTDLIVGPTFSQQTKQNDSIPDLQIIQKSFSVFFETKMDDWYYGNQILRHISGFNSDTHLKILFLLCNFDDRSIETRFQKEISEARNAGIIIQPLSFEDFVGALEQVSRSEYLITILDEFKVFLDRGGLLPKWKHLLDVVNCKGTMHEITENVYMCPDTGGAYSHRRAKYFGPYTGKVVSSIFEIKAVVVVDINQSDAIVKWKDPKHEDAQLIDEAIQKMQLWDLRIDENKSVPLQVFLLDNRATTHFEKRTSGGMIQSKKYFWDIAVGCDNSEELATKLMGKGWDQV
jgi:hypothetical protein